MEWLQMESSEASEDFLWRLKGPCMQITQGRASYTEETANAKALRQEKVWCVRRRAKRSKWLEQSWAGKKGVRDEVKGD